MPTPDLRSRARNLAEVLTSDAVPPEVDVSRLRRGRLARVREEMKKSEIQAGDLVALDTDVIGPFGYYADFSRTFRCGPGKPTEEQHTLYRLAWEQINFNVDVIKPGMTFREIAEKAWPIPEPYLKNRYFVLAHGVGMTGEYPYILHRQDIDASGYEGVVEAGMTLCVESYVGAEGGADGVKLEHQVLMTETGAELLSRFPFEDDLLGREI